MSNLSDPPDSACTQTAKKCRAAIRSVDPDIYEVTGVPDHPTYPAGVVKLRSAAVPRCSNCGAGKRECLRALQRENRPLASKGRGLCDFWYPLSPEQKSTQLKPEASLRLS
ncbi:hypothetical protein VTK26DRAFT_7414 [Humicola hyalothermophila]